MATTYTLIDKTTLGSTQANVEFTSISSAYTDLLLKFSCRTAHGNVVTNFEVSFNGVTTNLSGIRIYGTGSGVASESNAYALSTGDTATANTFTNGDLYIPNYTSSNYKSFSIDDVTENNATAAYAVMAAGLWSSTSSINAIKLTPNAGSGWLSESSFYLYGIKNS
jgi:hypothetical protein